MAKFKVGDVIVNPSNGVIARIKVADARYIISKYVDVYVAVIVKHPNKDTVGQYFNPSPDSFRLLDNRVEEAFNKLRKKVEHED